MTYEFGNIVLVSFPFSSNFGKKKRPAVIISKLEFNNIKEDIVLLAITSKVNNLAIGESLLIDWGEAGLLKPSAFKSVIFTVEKQVIDKTIGKLTNNDKDILLKCLKEILP